MTVLPRNLYRARDVRELDRTAIEGHGIAGLELMHRAGDAAFTRIRQNWPQLTRLTLLCGPGNNGGDGFVIARLAHDAGIAVAVYLLADPERLQGDAARAYASLRSTGIVTTRLDATASSALLDELADPAARGRHIVVDALFGTGLTRDIDPELAGFLVRLNALGLPSLAIDIPSGLHADSGRVLGAAFRATATISFIGLKPGLFTGLGPNYCGDVYFDDLNVPAAVYAGVPPLAERIDYDALPASAAELLRRRQRCAHKGDHGHVLVIGGGPGMAGAVRMAAEAAARVGAGLVSAGTHRGNAAHISAACPVIMAHDIVDSDQLMPLLRRATVVAIGPGLGREAWGNACLQRTVDTCMAIDKAMVIDADALNGLAEDPCHYEHWVMTPHPGEAARLLGTDTAEIQADRLAAAEAIQHRYGGVCVLKGAGTIIQSADQPRLCNAANPALASGGMGDVLTGIIAGLLAQGGPPAAAASLGVSVHARAADIAAVDGQRGLLATELLAHLRRLVNPEPRHDL